jgi:Uma2 family endonuclease
MRESRSDCEVPYRAAKCVGRAELTGETTAPKGDRGMATIFRPPEGQVVLHDISWSLYERLLAEHDSKRSPRFTYNCGELEIMVLSYVHEECNRLIDHLITLVAVEWDVECRDAGSTTFKSEELAKGLEPDSCFYLQNAERIAGKKQLDLRTDPPPDLVVEVEITRSALDRMAIFAAVGVPEVWRCDSERVQVLRLIEGGYVEQERSLALPMLTGEILTELLERSQHMASTAWRRSVLAWARAQREGAASSSG